MSEAVLLSPSYLTTHALFQDWDQAELKSLLAESKMLNFNKGTFIFKRGEHNTGFYIIDEGQVQLQLRSPRGMVKELKRLKMGESVGEAYTLMNKPYRVEAVALSQVRLLKIEKNVFFNYLAQQPNLMLKLIATLSERLNDLLNDVLTANLQSGTQRVIYYLLGDTPLKNGSETTLTKPKSQIAASLNLTPEHFSRILQDLITRGLIEVNGRHIVFLDVDGLCEYER